MKKLSLLLLTGVLFLLGITTLAAQNSVDILNSGPQPTNTAGCAINPHCLPATWSTTSNANPTPADISSAISNINFVFVPHGGASPADVPAAASGRICLADTRDLGAPTLFAQIATNCKLGGGIALLLINNGAVNAPSTIPVFTIALTDGDFLRNTVGFNAMTGISNYLIRINTAPAATNLTGQHNCPSGQITAAYVGTGTANYTPNESLCLPSGAGQAVEPSMTVDSQGTIYVESIRGVPGGLDLWRWYQAKDGAPNSNGTLPFKYEGQPDCGIFVTTFCTKSGLAPGGGDGDVAVNLADPSNSNIPNLAVVSLDAAEVTGSQSTNRADTFSTPNPATAGVPFDDRMWLDALNDTSHVYMEYHDFGTTSQIFVQRSNNGGQTYNDAAGIAIDAVTEPNAGAPTGNIAGQIKVDNSSTGSHGNVYQIFVGPDNPTDNANSIINAVYVGVASNVSLTNPVLTFTDYKIYSCGAGSKCASGLGLGNLFPALAVDNFGYVYATWADGTDVYYSYSTTHGTSWSPAMKITQGTSQAGRSNVFTWMAADANGHVAIAWYGANQAGNSNTLPLTAQWNVFVAETVNGHAITPVFTLSQATDHANHTGQISTGGLLGSSDRSLADFFQIAMDPNHLVNIAFADNHAGPSISYFTREKKAAGGIQTCGHGGDGDGDENGHKGGKAHFHIHHDDCGASAESETYSDPGAGSNFQSTQVNSVTYDDIAQSMTIVGTGTDNGVSVAFTIVAVDSSLLPPGLFTITLSDGYTNTGTLVDGSISLH